MSTITATKPTGDGKDSARQLVASADRILKSMRNQVPFDRQEAEGIVHALVSANERGKAVALARPLRMYDTAISICREEGWSAMGGAIALDAGRPAVALDFYKTEIKTLRASRNPSKEELAVSLEVKSHISIVSEDNPLYRYRVEVLLAEIHESELKWYDRREEIYGQTLAETLPGKPEEKPIGPDDREASG